MTIFTAAEEYFYVYLIVLVKAIDFGEYSRGFTWNVGLIY